MQFGKPAIGKLFINNSLTGKTQKQFIYIFVIVFANHVTNLLDEQLLRLNQIVNGHQQFKECLLPILLAEIESDHFGVVIEERFAVNALGRLEVAKFFDDNIGQTIGFAGIAIIAVCVQFQTIDKCIRPRRIEFVQHVRQNGSLFV